MPRKPRAGAAPAHLFVATVAWVFLVEVSTMWVVEVHQSRSVLVNSLLDAVSLVCVAAPLIFVLLYRPLVRSLRDRERVEAELRETQGELERRVLERTAALERSNRSLGQEAESRKQADERVQFQTDLLDNVEQSVIATDLEGRIVYWNRYSEKLYGWLAEEVQGRPISEVHMASPEFDPAKDSCSLLGEGQSWEGEVELRRKDGSLFPAQLACFPVFDRLRRLRSIVHLSTDISSRRAAAAALEHSEKRYTTLVEDSPTGIFVARREGLVFANPKLEEITGYSRTELVSRDWLTLVHPEDRPRMQEIAERTFGGEDAPRSYSCRVVTRGGAIRWADVRWTPIEHGGRVSAIGSVQDVTQNKEAETALARSREALHRLSGRLLKAQEDERQRVARELHDGIGQSLSAARFALERTLGAPWPEERRKEVLAIRQVISVLQDAMEDVRRISMGLRPPMLDDLGLFAALSWLSREVRTAAPEMRVETRFEVEETEVPEDLKVVIFRISQEAANNALKHSRASRIRICVGQGDGCIELAVEDDGVGFDPDATDSERPAWGLGLRTMKERAELSGGAFSLASAPGGGTSLKARWPLGG